MNINNKNKKKPNKEDIKHLIKTAEKYSAYSKIKDYFMLIEKEEKDEHSDELLLPDKKFQT
jgi:hypothetical protein